MTSPSPTIQQEPAQSDLFSRAVLVTLELGKLGNTRKTPTGAVQVDANKERLRLSKKLIASDTYDAISKIDSTIRADVYSLCLPSPFGSGIYIIPLELIADLDARLQVYKNGRENAVDKLCQEYPGLVEVSRRELGVLFNADDYPAVEDVRAEFTMTWSYLSVSVPQALGQISPALLARETDRARRQIEQATEDIRAALREGLAELVSHMTERLTPTEDGKPRIFRDTLVSNFADFLRTFEARNITDDADLARIASEARALLTNGGGRLMDAQKLRESDTARSKVAAGMKEIEAQLETMIQTAPRRRIQVNPQAQPAQAQEAASV